MYRIGTRISKLIYDINQEIPDVATSANLRSLREILKISSKMKADGANNGDEAAIVHFAFILFFETQLTPKVISRLYNSTLIGHILNYSVR